MISLFMRETLPRFCLAARRFSLDGFGFCRRKAVTVRRHAAGAVAGALLTVAKTDGAPVLVETRAAAVSVAKVRTPSL